MITLRTRSLAGWSAAVFLVASQGLSCTSGTPDTSREGPIVAWNSDIRPIRGVADDEVAFVAVVPALTTVELIRGGAAGFTATPIPPPGGCSASSPMTLEVLDLTGDGRDDVFVLDPCGSWIAIRRDDGTFESRPASELLGELPGFRQVDAIDVDRDGDRDLIFTMSEQLVLVEQLAPGRWGVPVLRSFDAPLVSESIARQAFVWPAREPGARDHLVMQRGSFLDAMPLEIAEERLDLLPAVELHREPEPTAHTAFDQVIETPDLAGCGVDALGLHVDQLDVTQSPRRLLALRLAPTSYEVTAWLTGVDVFTFAVHPASTPDARLISVLGRREGRMEFSVLRTTECGRPEVLGSTPVDFQWETARLPINEFEPLVQLRAMRVVGFGSEATGVGLVHYDGFTVRRFHASADSGWRAVRQSFPLHTVRNDYPAR